MGCLLVFSVAYAQSIKPNANLLGSNNVASKLPGQTNPSTEPRQPVSSSPTHSSEGIRHSIRATKSISEEVLRHYLETKVSPLVPWAGHVGESPYWSTIIAICTIEEYSCSVNPHGTNNLWGLMAQGQLIYYDSLGAGIQAISNFLAKADDNGRTTIESFRGWYCYEAATADHICQNWESVVIKVKTELENLN